MYMCKPPPRNFVLGKLCVQLSFFVNKTNTSSGKIAFEFRLAASRCIFVLGDGLGRAHAEDLVCQGAELAQGLVERVPRVEPLGKMIVRIAHGPLTRSVPFTIQLCRMTACRAHLVIDSV